MNKTMYFTTNYENGIRVWRYKNGKMEFYSPNATGWHPSACEIGVNNGEGWRQISRDEARKLDGKAFR